MTTSSLPIILPTCYTCRMPGVKTCKCGRKYCGEHTAVWNEQVVCLACKEAAVQNQFAIAKGIAVVCVAKIIDVKSAIPDQLR